MKHDPSIHTRRAFLRLAGITLGAPLLPSFLPSAFAAAALPDFRSLTLEQQVGQLIIARQQDWQSMEKYAKKGLISGITPSLTKLSPAEVADFTNKYQKLSPIPLLFGWGGISYRGGTEVRLGQTMRPGPPATQSWPARRGASRRRKRVRSVFISPARRCST